MTESKTENVEEIALMASDNLLAFVAEANFSAILDTACSKTVCGKRWLQSYVQGLSSKQCSELILEESSNKFRFGSGDPIAAVAQVKIPAVNEEVPCSITTEILELDLPLLLSKFSLKRASTCIDLEQDKDRMFVVNTPELLVKVHGTS